MFPVLAVFSASSWRERQIVEDQLTNPATTVHATSINWKCGIVEHTFSSRDSGTFLPFTRATFWISFRASSCLPCVRSQRADSGRILHSRIDAWWLKWPRQDNFTVTVGLKSDCLPLLLLICSYTFVKSHEWVKLNHISVVVRGNIARQSDVSISLCVALNIVRDHNRLLLLPSRKSTMMLCYITVPAYSVYIVKVLILYWHVRLNNNIVTE